MKRFGLMAALALIVLVNVIVLTGVRYNRSGEPDAVVTLTERELHLEPRDKENSGVALHLELQSEHNNWSEPSDWFDRTKLTEVGFDCSIPLEASNAALHYEKQLPRKSFVVLEYEGKAWEDWQNGREKHLNELAARVTAGEKTKKSLDAELKRFRWEKAAGSRLFAVDVGNDPASLRSRYPDRHKYIITPARVRLHLLSSDDNGKPRKPVLTGYVDELLTDSLQVPRDRQGVLASLKPDQLYYYQEERKESFSPRYMVKLQYGQRYEPWVVAVLPP